VGAKGYHGLWIAPSATYPGGSGIARSMMWDQPNECVQYGFTVDDSFVVVKRFTKAMVLWSAP